MDSTGVSLWRRVEAVKKLLVVDDEKDICDFVKNFFGKRGFNVLSASNGEEALPIIEKEKPDITLLDIRMPKLGGIETLRQMKAKDPTREVIMVTCVDDLEKMKEAKELGAHDYITKPLVLDELARKVKELAEKL
jgi:DNA-binding response OmpR family regulator